MRTARLSALSVLVGAALVAPVANAAAGGPGQAQAFPERSQRPVCGLPAAGTARCHAHVVTLADGITPFATSTYLNGYAPADLRNAYALNGLAPSGAPTVAIVDAYDNPNVESDLGAYRSQFGLGACTTGNGCFRKVNQSGGSSMPAGDVGWGQEIALDVEMVSAICPACHILLVEAASSSLGNLLTAEQYAAAHAQYVSNSWGTSESLFTGLYDSYFDYPGVAVTVSSGDGGYGVDWPAAAPTVTAVGGTSLSRNASVARGWSESAWSGAGSGCSAYESKPSWQNGGCSNRTVADVSAVADPYTGVAVYDSYGSSNGNNWFVFGGTSVAAPIIASVFAVGGGGGGSGYPAALPYSHTGALNDVTTGSNGSCGGSNLCTATSGYDGPTGLGTPSGTGAFGGGGGGGSTPPPPVASFTYSCTNLACTFTDTSTNATSWSWSFGDGGTSTVESPSHTYASASTYHVSLTVNGGSTAAQDVTVNAAPTSYQLTVTKSSATKKRAKILLQWSPPDTITIYRNGTAIATGSAGSYTDNVPTGATYTYRVCSGSVCSANQSINV